MGRGDSTPGVGDKQFSAGGWGWGGADDRPPGEAGRLTAFTGALAPVTSRSTSMRGLGAQPYLAHCPMPQWGTPRASLRCCPGRGRQSTCTPEGLSGGRSQKAGLGCRGPSVQSLAASGPYLLLCNQCVPRMSVYLLSLSLPPQQVSSEDPCNVHMSWTLRHQPHLLILPSNVPGASACHPQCPTSSCLQLYPLQPGHPPPALVLVPRPLPQLPGLSLPPSCLALPSPQAPAAPASLRRHSFAHPAPSFQGTPTLG